jgi:hypothetical protein
MNYFRRGFWGSKGISLTIHQELSTSWIDFAELTCPVPGTATVRRDIGYSGIPFAFSSPSMISR